LTAATTALAPSDLTGIGIGITVDAPDELRRTCSR